MSDFQPGEIVDITIKGVRPVRIRTEGHDNDVIRTAQVAIYDSSGKAYHTVLPLEWDTVTVERRAPAEWPPQPGDLWRRDDTDDLYFAADVHDDGETAELEIVMVCAYDDHRLDPETFRSHCAGRMTLVYREGEQGGAS
jgi:hypothetical protein